ncbi:MAG: hypothetical protein EBT75_10145 [Proteobacteria bacterium]|nr:hypothetical protein [Pseudomonadota bacterium]
MLKPDPSRLGSRLFRLIAKGEIVTYGYVAVLLLVISSIYLVQFILTAMLNHQPFFSTLISVINEVLLILIVMEILRTVTRLLVSPAHDVSIADLVPFLVIAGISVTRRILTIGAGLSVQETEGHNLDSMKFTQSMTELLVSGVIIVLVSVSLWLIHRKAPAKAV